jgi:hypothetical protein
MNHQAHPTNIVLKEERKGNHHDLTKIIMMHEDYGTSYPISPTALQYRHSWKQGLTSLTQSVRHQREAKCIIQKLSKEQQK